jgi:dTDP-4-dehydrorhamnose reductase
VKVAVVGASGQLGSSLCAVLEEGGLECEPLSHDRLEVADPDSVAEVLRAVRPDAVVNTAAFHRVDACEDDPQQAFAVNALGALYVARACREVGARCVYVSTDYVFDGARAEPYTEDDRPNPLNVYGASKLAGEHLVLQTCPDALVVRVASLFGGRGARGKGTNFVLTVLDRAGRGETLRVVDDVRMSPTYTVDAARAVVQLVRRGASGVFHVVNEGACTWYELARTVVRAAGLDVPVEPVPQSAYPSRARRPANSALSAARLAALGLSLRPWPEAVAEYVAQLVGHPAPGGLGRAL